LAFNLRAEAHIDRYSIMPLPVTPMQSSSLYIVPIKERKIESLVSDLLHRTAESQPPVRLLMGTSASMGLFV
jgi:hypothetical protein